MDPPVLLKMFLLFAGRGIFAKGTICKGDFVVQYRGEV